MRLRKVIGAVAVLAIVGAACGDDDAATTTTPAATTTTAGTTATAVAGPLAEFGEDPGAADPALVEKALGPVTPSDDASWNIILASIARADQDPDQAIIDKALECWRNAECETGTGGEIVMGYADGGGDTVNVWRGVSHMEAILQALPYPEIGRIVSTAANFDFDPEVHANQVRFLVQADVDFIVGYPDVGVALAAAGAAAQAG